MIINQNYYLFIFFFNELKILLRLKRWLFCTEAELSICQVVHICIQLKSIEDSKPFLKVAAHTIYA